MGASLCSVFQGLRGNGNQGKAKARPLVGGNGEFALVLWKFGGGGGGVVVVRSFFGAGRRQRRLLAEAAVGLASLMIAAVATISCFLTQPGSLA